MVTADRPIVVVSGLPGSGKSTLAHAVGALMALPVFDKDDILEELFDTRGVGDAEWRRQLSRESDVILQARVSSSAGAVVTSFWHAPGMPANSGTPTGWLPALSRTIVTVRCDCPPDVAARRFAERSRHVGHLDATRAPADVVGSIEALVPLGHVAIGELVVVDTAQPVDPAAVVGAIMDALRRCAARPR
jgi:glucokinase